MRLNVIFLTKNSFYHEKKKKCTARPQQVFEEYQKVLRAGSEERRRKVSRLFYLFNKKVTRGFCNNFYSKFSLSKKRLKNNFIYYTRKIGNVFSPDHPRNINLKDSVDIF